MPITMPPISRRQFMVGTLAGLSAAVTVRRLSAEENAPDPHRFALFADTHIAGDRTTVVREANMTENFMQAAREVLDCDPRPASVLMCGDCAYLEGKAEDYKTLVGLVQPLRQSDVPVHLLMGNHDHRERFFSIVEEGHPQPSPIPSRHILVIETPRANWFLLDSLDETNKTPGVLGQEQLDWLATVLDQRRDKPALVMVHHNPDRSPSPSGLVETDQLLKLLLARDQVKVLFYGHSHHWSLGRQERLHLVNLPPVAYLFQEGDPNGWVDARIRPDGITLVISCIDKQHSLHGKRCELSWA